MGPMKKDHPAIGDVCRLCGSAILIDQYVSLVALPPTDPEARARARQGRAYNTEAAVVHWDCVVTFDLPHEEGAP